MGTITICLLLRVGAEPFVFFRVGSNSVFKISTLGPKGMAIRASGLAIIMGFKVSGLLVLACNW